MSGEKVAERKKIRFISEEPRVALKLREWRPVIIPQDLYDYGVDWIEDVGSIMRTRSYMAGTVASYVSYGVMLLLFSVVPLDLFPFAKKVLKV